MTGTDPKPPTTNPSALYRQAQREHPADVVACNRRYRELMREHGHLVDREPGDDGNLPCGWPGRSAADQPEGAA